MKNNSLYEDIKKLNTISDDENINEDNKVKSALFGDIRNKIRTFGIMTAENPMGKPLSPSENNKRTNELKTYFKNMRLQYIPIQGVFDVGEPNPNDDINYGDNKYVNGKRRPEHSFIIINPSLGDMKGLSNKFNQLSFFYGETNPIDLNSKNRDTTSNIYYYGKEDENSDYKLIDQSKKVNDATNFDNFFSRYKDYKYSIYMKCFESLDSLAEIINEDAMDYSLNDEYMARHRAFRRLSAYKWEKEN